MVKYITIRMTVEEALRQGLIICECDHPLNNHFGTAEGCARCGCTKYHQVARVGKLVKVKRKDPKVLIPKRETVRTSKLIRQHVWKSLGILDVREIEMYECQRCRVHTKQHQGYTQERAMRTREELSIPGYTYGTLQTTEEGLNAYPEHGTSPRALE